LINKFTNKYTCFDNSFMSVILKQRTNLLQGGVVQNRNG